MRNLFILFLVLIGFGFISCKQNLSIVDTTPIITDIYYEEDDTDEFFYMNNMESGSSYRTDGYYFYDSHNTKNNIITQKVVKANGQNIEYVRDNKIITSDKYVYETRSFLLCGQRFHYYIITFDLPSENDKVEIKVMINENFSKEYEYIEVVSNSIKQRNTYSFDIKYNKTKNKLIVTCLF